MPADPGLPLLRGGDGAIAMQDGQPVSRAAFLAEVAAVARLLPDAPHVLNLCASRTRFVIAWAAAMLRGQVTLLPNSRDAATLAALAADYPGCYAVCDDPGPRDLPMAWFGYPTLGRCTGDAPVPRFPRGQVAAILFTSGSTGRPVAVPRSWGRLVAASIAAGDALGIGRHAGAALVATVPHVHSYGLESAVMLPLQHGLLLTADSPMLPADIRAALAGAQAAVLVTTPVHLRALTVDAPSPARAGLVLSATAPLSAGLAAEAERLFAAPVHEIYGCSEAGQIASRRTVEGPAWQCLDGFSLRHDGADCLVSAADEPDVALGDDLELAGGGRFILRGRKADMVDVAGKRSSLAHLNYQLATIPGVLDGVFVAPDAGEAGIPRRLAALAVAPGLDAATVMAALRGRVDPVFLPRPLRIVAALPRNATGKLPRAALLQLLGQAVRVHFPPDHPAGPGHFPGNPLIPGAALLDAVVAALFPGEWAGTVDSVKFTHPVRPGDTVELDCELSGPSARFGARLAGTGQLAMSGTLRLAAV